MHGDDESEPLYNRELVECCRTYREGGFTRAFLLLRDEHKIKIKSKRAPRVDGGFNRIFYISLNGKRAKRVGLGEVKDELIVVWNLMCDAFTDFKMSEDYDADADIDFDDSYEWVDYMHIVNDENIHEICDT